MMEHFRDHLAAVRFQNESEDEDEQGQREHLTLGAVPDSKYLCILVSPIEKSAKRKREGEEEEGEEGEAKEAKEEEAEEEVKPEGE